MISTTASSRIWPRLSYTLSTAGAELDPAATRSRAAIDEAGAHVRQLDLLQLRSLLVELYPP